MTLEEEYKRQGGLLIVLSGPSGTGKNTVLHSVTQKDKRLNLSISATTRKPRTGERDGENYYFMSEEKFLDMVKNRRFLEYAKYCGNYYGTPLDRVCSLLDCGKDVILEIDISGGCQVKERCPEAISIFLSPPSVDVLKKRILNRGINSVEDMDRRLKVAERELKFADKYDYIVFNDDLEKCVSDVLSIINSERMKSSRNKYVIRELL